MLQGYNYILTKLYTGIKMDSPNPSPQTSSPVNVDIIILLSHHKLNAVHGLFSG